MSLQNSIEITVDPNCIIIFRGDSFVVYYNMDSFESWIIFGICNKCGDCLPDDWLEPTHRLDIPVRPEIKQKIKRCSLMGLYL